MTKKVSVLDLTAGQVEAIEIGMGLPVSQWQDAPSLVSLYVRILSAANGEPEETYRAMSMKDLIALVSLDADEDPKA
jgi:hypothetical protein